MKRTNRALLARETLQIVDDGYYTLPSGADVSIASALAASVKGTRLYAPGETIAATEHARSNGVPAIVEVTPETTLEAARRLARECDPPDPLCLNFASAKNPGGGFLGGSQAQEESLARSSGLYRSLTNDMKMYMHNRSLETMLYSDYMIYSPNVPVFRDDDGELLEQPYTTSFITAPAVNAGALAYKEPENAHLIRPVMRSRLERLLAIAAMHGHQALVLGAWGCGVFANDPVMVAELFRETLGEGGPFASSFRRVVYAVFDRSQGQATLTAFQRTLATGGS